MDTIRPHWSQCDCQKYLLNSLVYHGRQYYRAIGGASCLGIVRSLIIAFSKEVARPDNPEQVQHKFLLQQWIEIKEMLGERDARDTGIYVFLARHHQMRPYAIVHKELVFVSGQQSSWLL
jgi:hypothetical protein